MKLLCIGLLSSVNFNNLAIFYHLALHKPVEGDSNPYPTAITTTPHSTSFVGGRGNLRLAMPALPALRYGNACNAGTDGYGFDSTGKGLCRADYV